MFGPLLGAGFTLERLPGPWPAPQFREQGPADYEQQMRHPGFLCVRAARGPAATPA
jgi:hypothetical protein